MRVVVAVAASLLVILLASCEKAAPQPPSGQRRVVVLSPAAGVAFRDMADRGIVPASTVIVGRHAYELALDHMLPVCGDQNSPDYEALLNAAPTDIVLQWGKREMPERFATLARKNKWKITNFDPLTLDEVVEAVTGLEAEFRKQGGVHDGTAAVLRSEMLRAFSRRGDFGRAGRIMLLAETRPIEALGPGSAHQQVLERIGGTPAIISGGSYRAMELEDVLNSAPDGIVLVMPRAKGTPREEISQARRREMLGKIGELAIPAVLNGRIAVIDDPLVQMPSSSLIGFADELAKILTEWSEGP